MPAERSPRRLNSDVRDRDRDQNGRRRLQDPLPLETLTSDSKQEAKYSSRTSDREAKELNDKTNPTALPRSRSFSKHDDRGTAGQDGRRSGRRLPSEHGGWRDSKNEDRTTDRSVGSDLNEKQKPEARGSDSRIWRHDRFNETNKNADPPAKRRRPFREEKLPQESEPLSSAPADPTKDIPHHNRQEERDRTRRPSERNNYGHTFVKSRSFSNREREEKTDMPLRDRVYGGEYDGRYRGRDQSGGRQAFRSSGGHGDRWKHDLYYEANTSPTKKEEDPVAKVEALLLL